MIRKLLMMVITLLLASSQSKVWTKNYGLQSYGKPNFNLGVLGQNDIWVQTPRPNIKNIIRGKVVMSLKSKPW
jgi:hypothetical protein